MSNTSNLLNESIASYEKESDILIISEKKKIEMTKIQKLKKKIYIFLMQRKIQYMFKPTFALINYILEKNNKLIENHSIDLKEFLFYNFDRELKMLDTIEKLNFEALKLLKDKINSNEINLKDFDRKFIEIFTNFQNNILRHSITFMDFSSEKIKNFPQKPLNNTNSYERLHLAFDENICFFNIKENENKTLEDIENLQITDFFFLLCEVLISNWEIFCYILLISYYFFNQGISCFFLFIYMFIYLIYEEKKAKMFAWKICLVYFVIIASLKLFLYLNMLSPSNEYSKDNASDYLPLIQV